MGVMGGPRRVKERSVGFSWYLGIDLGSDAHHFCLLDAQGQVRGARTVAHTAIAIHEAVQWVRDCTAVACAEIAVAVEAPRGIVLDTFLEQGFAVFAVNPKQLDRFRDRFTASGAKDDRRDGHVLADSLRTDQRAFRRLAADDPQIIALRELSRLLDDLQEEEGRLINRLREQLYRVDAPWLRVSPAATDAWLWAILKQAPHPAQWPQLPRRRIASILREHRIRRVGVDDVLTVLRHPTLRVMPGVTDAAAIRIEALVAQLLLVHQQRSTVERQIDRALARLAHADADGEPREHRDVEILQSLPGVGRVVAATMLTEATSALANRDYHTLRAYTGAAPVTKRSGKRMRVVHMRYACKRRLREALYHWARTSTQHDLAARAYYRTLRVRGHSHGRALRSVGMRWLRILVAMLRTKTLYDASRFAETAEQSA
jgi:transposase